MPYHHTQDPHVVSLLNLLQIVIQQNMQLQQQIQDQDKHHHICADILIQIRTPLTIIRTSANIVQRYHERLTSEKRDEHLSNIDTQVTVITNLIEQLGQ